MPCGGVRYVTGLIPTFPSTHHIPDISRKSCFQGRQLAGVSSAVPGTKGAINHGINLTLYQVEKANKKTQSQGPLTAEAIG